MPARAEVVATLTFKPEDADFSQDSHVYLEERSGVRVVKLTARSRARDEP